MENTPKEPDKGFRIAAIYGSPRKGGNTSILMDRFIEGAGEAGHSLYRTVKTNRIYAGKLNISPCRECCNCSRTGKCIIADDMQEIYEVLIDADFIAVSTPIFFTTVSGYLKAIIDRCQRFWALKYEHNKNIIKKPRGGIFISTSGSGAKDIFKCSIKVIRSFFDVLFVDYLKDFTFNTIEKKGDILDNEEAISALFEFGKNMNFNNEEGK